MGVKTKLTDSKIPFHKEEAKDFLIRYLINNPKTTYENEALQTKFNKRFPTNELIYELSRLYLLGVVSYYEMKFYYICDTMQDIIEGAVKTGRTPIFEWVNIMLFTNEDKNKLLWKALFSCPDIFSDEEKTAFIKSCSYMPDKGCVGIQVAEGKQEQAVAILKEHVGDFEFEYYPEDYELISDSELPWGYYGKFEIEDLEGLLNKFIDNGITIINVRFYIPE